MSEEQVYTQEPEFNLDEMFDKIHAHIENPTSLEEGTLEKPETKKISVPIEKKEEIEDESDDEETEKIPEKKEKPSDKKSESDLKVAFDKLEKSHKDTQKSFHEDRKKLSAYKRAVLKLKEEGTLLDEEAEMLLDHTKFEGEVNNSSSGSILDRYVGIWDKEIKSMRRYSPDASEIDQHILAFQHLYDSSTLNEKQEILDDLSDFEDDEVELTKKMLALGRRHNDEIYSDIHEAGGLSKLKDKYQDKIDKLEKELDKSNKRYNKLKEKYEDYNEPSSLTLPGGSNTPSSSKGDNVDLDAFFDSLARG
jgi:hypothetical protein